MLGTKIEDKWMVFAVTGLANFIATFTTSSINLALPGMSAEFGVSMGVISWVSLIYMLTLSCSLMVFGRIGDLYGYKKLFIGGFTVFALMSLLLPLFSINLPLLILFRCFQAVGGSMLISITQAIVSKTFGAAERGKALGINSVFVSIGLAVGPTFGGWLLDYFSWHALFYVNIPFSLLGILAAMKYLKRDKTQSLENGMKMDWMGAAVFSVMIFALSIAINFVDDWGFVSGRFLGCLGVTLLCLGLFIHLEKHQSEPLMELSLFKNKKFSLSTTACLLSYLAQMMTTFLMPFFLVNILLLSQDQSGLVMLATPLVMMLASPFGGKMADRYGTKGPAGLGLAAVALGCGLLSQLQEGTSMAYILFCLALLGLGNGYSVSAINTAVLGSVPGEHSGVASGMVATVRNMGQSLGVAFGGMMIALRTSAYTVMGQIEGNTIYVAAQRDAFFFCVLVALTALAAIALIPNSPRASAN